jgi:hypothetical protein
VAVALVVDTVGVDDAVPLAVVAAAADFVVGVDWTAATVWLGVEELAVFPHAAASVAAISEAPTGESMRERTIIALRGIILSTLRPLA